MEATERTDKQQQQAEPVYLESTLLRVFGVLFCHDPKRARSRTGTIEINRGVAEKGIATGNALRRYRDAWDHAADRTPHGMPIELEPQDFGEP